MIKTDEQQPIDDSPNSVTPPIIQPESPHKSPVLLDKMMMPLIIMFVLLPVLVFAAVNFQSLVSQARGPICVQITSVMINVDRIETLVGAPPTNLSALAYDGTSNQIGNGVHYDWGISSNNSIGRVKGKNQIADFLPMKPGTGDLFVKAKNACTKTPVVKSIRITVSPPLPL